jgi:putative transposase
MQLVEQHLIRKGNPRFAVIDRAAFASKNLYNQANYQIRQAFIHEGKYLPYVEVFHRLKQHEAYCALPRKVSNSILIQLHKNWLAFFKANDAYRRDPSNFVGRPKIPGYKDKEKGCHILVYDKQALGKRAYKKTGKIVPSGLPIEIETKVSWEATRQVRIIPRGSCYVVEVVYQKAEQQAHVDPDLFAALDLGVNVLAAVTSTKPNFQPLLINGRPLKSINQQFFNSLLTCG